MNDAFANCAAILAGIPGMLGEFPGTDNKPPAEIKRNHLLYGPRCEKTCLQGFENNTGSDQPAHPHRLISAFVFRLLETIISKLLPAKFKFSS